MTFVESLKEIEKYLKGKKSYISVLFIAGYTMLKSFNIINTTPDQDFTVYGFLTALLGFSLRDAISTSKTYARK